MGLDVRTIGYLMRIKVSLQARNILFDSIKIYYRYRCFQLIEMHGLFLPYVCDCIDLNQNAQQLAAHGCASGFGIWEVRGVDFIVALEK